MINETLDLDNRFSFRSKVDWWLVLILVWIPILTSLPQLQRLALGGSPNSSAWLSLLVVAGVVLALFPTRYVIEGETVSIKCGVIGWECDAFRVQDVQTVEESHDVLAAPALSLDRLRIDLGLRRDIVISPKDKAGFLRALAAIDAQLRPVDGSLVRRV